MEPHKKVFNECMELVEIAILERDDFVQEAIDGGMGYYAGVNAALYDVYSKAKGLRIKVSEQKFQADTVKYNDELICAQYFVEAREPYYRDFIRLKPFDSWIAVHVDVKNARPATYRLYLNLQIHNFCKFTSELWRTITYYIYCTCGSKAKYDNSLKKIVCPTCRKDNFYFSFKFHKPYEKTPLYKGRMSDLLRHDKIVMYFPDEESAKAMAKTLMGFKSLFEPKTMPFSGEIFPGLGFAVEPSPEEKAEYAAATDDPKASFGEFITWLLAMLIIRAVQSKKAQVKMMYDAWKAKYPERMGKTIGERYKERTILFNSFSSLLGDQILSLIAGEPRFKRYFDELIELERLTA